jgi:DNA-3-methyladenine glycosylase II
MPYRSTDVAAAVKHLGKVDPVLKNLIRRVGPFTLKTHRDRFDLLVRSILSQQISTKAARAIRLRLADRVAPDSITPAAISHLSDADLRAVGLSSQKVSYLRDLAEHTLSGRLPLHRLGRMDDDAVIERLVEVRGIGVWTAQMFLMFALGRLDVFPHDDLGLRSSLKSLYGLADLPDKKTSHAISAPWSPYRTIASWYCWRLFDLKSDPNQDASVYPV